MLRLRHGLLCCALALLAGCSGGQGKSGTVAAIVPPLSWPVQQSVGTNLAAAEQAVVTAARPLVGGRVQAVKLFFDGNTPVGEVVMALAGRPGAGRFVWLRRPEHQTSFRLDGSVDGRSILNSAVIGARYSLDGRSFVLAVTQPTCQRLVLTGPGLSSQTVTGSNGVFELSSPTAYTEAHAILPGHTEHTEPLLIVTA